MAVYFIQGESRFGPIKIGYSNDPDNRLIYIQISHWETLRIIRRFEGAETEERALHERFSDLHIRGEWHSFSKAMLGDVGLVEIIPESPVLPLPPLVIDPSGDAAQIGATLRELRASRGWTQAVTANIIGISRSTLANIEAGHDFPGRSLLVSIARTFDVTIEEVIRQAPAVSTEAAA